MFNKLATAAFVLTLAPACIYVEDDDRPQQQDPPVTYNSAPYVVDGEAGCYWSDYYADEIWYFEVVADDPDGALDVVEVWADVYDEWSGGQFVESFELYPDEYDDTLWFSDWLQSSTYLGCGYDGYSVDLVVYDTYDEMDWITVTPVTW